MSNMRAKFRYDIEQGSDVWHEIRKRSITATDISVLMDSNPWVTPFMLFEQKLGYRTVEENEAMREGKRLEPYARAELQKLFGVELNAPVCFHATNEWAMASLDAIDDQGKYLCEIKCSRKYYEQAKAGNFSAHVFSQAQWQLYVTDLTGMFLYSYYDNDGILIHISRNDVYINKCVEKAMEFKQCLNTLEPPSLTTRDVLQRTDAETLELAQEWKKAKEALKLAEEQEEALRSKLIDLAGDCSMECEDVKVTKYYRAGSVDYKKIPALQDVDLNQYRKAPSVAWRVS